MFDKFFSIELNDNRRKKKALSLIASDLSNIEKSPNVIGTAWFRNKPAICRGRGPEVASFLSSQLLFLLSDVFP